MPKIKPGNFLLRINDLLGTGVYPLSGLLPKKRKRETERDREREGGREREREMGRPRVGGGDGYTCK